MYSTHFKRFVHKKIALTGGFLYVKLFAIKSNNNPVSLKKEVFRLTTVNYKSGLTKWGQTGFFLFALLKGFGK